LTILAVSANIAAELMINANNTAIIVITAQNARSIGMLTLRDIHVIEALARAGQGCHRRTRAPGDEGPRRSLAHAAAATLGRTLISLGARLLAFGGERTRLDNSDLAHYNAPTPISWN
jgi:hypothetical protein